MAGASPEQTALREVREEGGIEHALVMVAFASERKVVQQASSLIRSVLDPSLEGS